MAEGYQNKYINPPDFSTIVRNSELTSGTNKEITSDGGWYCVRANNGSTSGPNWAYIISGTVDTNSKIISSSYASDNSAYVRCTTEWMYFPKGTKFIARAGFTDTIASGVYFCNEL